MIHKPRLVAIIEYIILHSLQWNERTLSYHYAILQGNENTMLKWEPVNPWKKQISKSNQSKISTMYLYFENPLGGL